MAVYLSPVAGVAAQFFNNDGVPLSGGKIYTYQAGTSTLANTYTTSAGNIAHANPIVLDSAGRVSTGEVWLLSTYPYKFILKDANDVLIATWDNVWGIGASGGLQPITPTIFNSTGTGSTTLYALGATPQNENTTNVYVNGVYQQKNSYSVVGQNLTFSEAPPITSLIEVSFN